jgi:hypothetical protein
MKEESPGASFGECQSISLAAILGLVNIGMFIMPVGLILALQGGILLHRKNRKQAAEG